MNKVAAACIDAAVAMGVAAGEVEPVAGLKLIERARRSPPRPARGVRGIDAELKTPDKCGAVHPRIGISATEDVADAGILHAWRMIRSVHVLLC